ncbi:MAG: multicopper oxidase domain-containing protein [Woeseiaceae bacterium]|nr:multicopper oxidase domain-containing protein [Woeseiaceae bacterium]
MVFDLGIREQAFDIAGGRGNAMTINDSVPGPLLEWYEGRDVVLNVTNHMHESTSIHWHGILLPFEMDGVQGVAFRGIEPGTTFQYRFPVKQSGTYWYHSHTRLQEQSGVYGPLVIHPKTADPMRYDRNYVVMLSDWTFDDPHNVIGQAQENEQLLKTISSSR